MGDGTIEGSGTQTATTPIDELWGVGRMRMRLFTEAGMDEPWRWGFKIAELDHGEIIDQPLNYIYPGGNTTIPGEAEWMRAALWFYEPNIQDGQATSMIRYRAYSNLGQSYSCQSTAPQSQRLWLGNVLGNKKWTIRIQGLSVPESVNDVDPYYGETTRKVYSTYYWEDRSRDDQDGPGPEDDIY